MAELKPTISYSVKGDTVISQPTLIKPFANRIVDNFEGINSLDANNDRLISLASKSFYVKPFGMETTTIKVQLQNLNTLWTNYDNTPCTIIQA